MSSAIPPSSYAVWEPILPHLPFKDIKSCYLVDHLLNEAVNHYLQENGIHSQDQLIAKVQEFMQRKLNTPESKWAASLVCHFAFNPYYQCRIIVGSHDQYEHLSLSKEELAYVVAVKAGSRSPDPDRKENWPVPYDEETCIFSKKLPKKPLPPCNDYVKLTPYAHAQTCTLAFDQATQESKKLLAVGITFPTEMDGFTRRTPHSETLCSDFIYTIQSIMQTIAPSRVATP